MVKILKIPAGQKILSIKLPSGMLKDIDLNISMLKQKMKRNSWVSDAVNMLNKNAHRKELVDEFWFEPGNSIQTKLKLNSHGAQALQELQDYLGKQYKISDIVRTAIIQKLIYDEELDSKIV